MSQIEFMCLAEVRIPGSKDLQKLVQFYTGEETLILSVDTNVTVITEQKKIPLELSFGQKITPVAVSENFMAINLKSHNQGEGTIER